MESRKRKTKKLQPLALVLAFIMGYIASRVIFAVFNFQYDIFTDQFDLGKLLIDFGIWAVCFGGALWGFSRLLARK